MMNFIRKFRRDEEGATAIEYALIAGLIGVAIIVGAQTLGTNINNKFDAIGKAIGTGTGTK